MFEKTRAKRGKGRAFRLRFATHCRECGQFLAQGRWAVRAASGYIHAEHQGWRLD